MELAELQKESGTPSARRTPWAILTEPSRRYGGWDPAEFFASGRAQIAGVMGHLRAWASGCAGTGTGLRLRGRPPDPSALRALR